MFSKTDENLLKEYLGAIEFGSGLNADVSYIIFEYSTEVILRGDIHTRRQTVGYTHHWWGIESERFEGLENQWIREI